MGHTVIGLGEIQLQEDQLLLGEQCKLLGKLVSKEVVKDVTSLNKVCLLIVH